MSQVSQCPNGLPLSQEANHKVGQTGTKQEGSYLGAYGICCTCRLPRFGVQDVHSNDTNASLLRYIYNKVEI
jgi:hypothetical protein